MKALLGIAIFVVLLGALMWSMFRSPPEVHNTDVDNGDGGLGSS